MEINRGQARGTAQAAVQSDPWGWPDVLDAVHEITAEDAVPGCVQSDHRQKARQRAVPLQREGCAERGEADPPSWPVSRAGRYFHQAGDEIDPRHNQHRTRHTRDAEPIRKTRMTEFKTTRNNHADDDHAAPSVAPMDSWKMATSILVGINRTLRQLEAEREALLEKHGGNPLAPGLMKLSHMTEALMDARRTLNPDLRNIARANGLTMPEGC